MIHSIFTFGKSVVRRIMPFGPLGGDYDFEEEQAESTDLISVGEFLISFSKLAEGTSAVDIIEMENTVRNASVEWFKLLVSHDGLTKLLGAASPESEKMLCSFFLNNKKFLDAVLSNSSVSAHQLAAGVKESPTIRRNVYLLLVSLGMHSYEGYVLIYKTVSLLQRERPNGMFQYITEEIAGATQSDARSREEKLEALIPPLALMVVIFAGGNGFFIESQLRKQIHGSHLLTALANTVQTKFTEEKHNRRLELPTLKEPSPRECTPQLHQAIEILEQAEKSSDRILRWLEQVSEVTGNGDTLSKPAELGSSVQYILSLDGPSQPKPVESPESGYESLVKIATKRQESAAEIEIGKTLPSPPIAKEAATGTPAVQSPPGALQSPPSVISFEDFSRGAGVVPPSPTTGIPDVPPVFSPSPDIRTEKMRPVAEVRPVTAVVSERTSAPLPPLPPTFQPPSVPVPSSSIVPPPPPPPPPPMMNANGSVVDSRICRSSLRPLRWTKLDTTPDVVMQSVWQPTPRVPNIDMDKLADIFRIEKSKGKFGGSKDSAFNTDVNPTSLISPQTELRINVILKQFPDISGEDLAKRIQSCDVSEFDESQLKELLTALPSDQEFDQIEKLKGQFQPTKPAEHFLLGLLEVDHLKLRLDVMLFVVEFPSTERSVRRNCQDIVNACEIIKSSESFRNFLQLVLKVGNKLNEGRAIGDAVAFDTNILPKLADVPSSQPRVSLLHFLVDQLRVTGPDTLKFLDELEPALEMARIPLGQMKNEVLAAREKYAQLLEEMQEVPDTVQKPLQKLLQGLRAKLNSLTNIVVEAQQRTQSLAMYLMEDPGAFHIHEYIEMLATFLFSIRSILELQTRHDSVSSSHKSDSESSALHSAPIFKDPNTASVFQSLRNELQTKLVLTPNGDSV